MIKIQVAKVTSVWTQHEITINTPKWIIKLGTQAIVVGKIGHSLFS